MILTVWASAEQKFDAEVRQAIGGFFNPVRLLALSHEMRKKEEHIAPALVRLADSGSIRWSSDGAGNPGWEVY
jgi:hypothetical protein